MLELDAFIKDQRLRGNSPATVAYYREALHRFVKATNLESLDELTEALVVDWRLAMLDDGRNPVTIQTYEKAVRVWCNWLVRKRQIAVSPFADVPRVKAPRNQGYQTFTYDDVQKMMKVARAKGKPNRSRDVAMLAVLLDTGIRAGELASLDLHGVDWNARSLFVRGKTGPRTVPAQNCLRYLHRYISEGRLSHPGVERAFTSRLGGPIQGRDVTVTVRRIAKDAGVQATKLGPHMFRHTFALEYLRSGGDVFSLMRILGHAELKTTERYVRWLTGDVAELHAHHSPASKWLR